MKDQYIILKDYGLVSDVLVLPCLFRIQENLFIDAMSAVIIRLMQQ